MEKKRNTKVIAMIVLSITLVCVTIAFALVSKSLTINGTTNMDTAVWDIHFENLSEPQIKGMGRVLNTPMFTGTEIKNYSVELSHFGDSITYTFDIVNAGDVNAKLLSFNKKNPIFTGTGDYSSQDAEIVKSNLTYELTYLDGAEINVEDELNAGESKTLKLVIAYTDATVSPDNDVSITGMDISMTYVQID